MTQEIQYKDTARRTAMFHFKADEDEVEREGDNQNSYSIFSDNILCANTKVMGVVRKGVIKLLACLRVFE